MRKPVLALAVLTAALTMVAGCLPYASVGYGTGYNGFSVGTGVNLYPGGSYAAPGFGSGAKQFLGTLGGAALGGWAGSGIGGGTGKLAAVGAGTLLGGLLGSGFGSSLDRADEVYARQAAAQAYAAPVGAPIQWSNPYSGNSGAVRTTREGWSASGAYCREFQQQIVVGGQMQSAFGQACQQQDGSWRIVG
jgi:surface antigen